MAKRLPELIRLLDAGALSAVVVSRWCRDTCGKRAVETTFYDKEGRSTRFPLCSYARMFQ